MSWLEDCTRCWPTERMALVSLIESLPRTALFSSWCLELRLCVDCSDRIPLVSLSFTLARWLVHFLPCVSSVLYPVHPHLLSHFAANGFPAGGLAFSKAAFALCYRQCKRDVLLWQRFFGTFSVPRYVLGFPFLRFDLAVDDSAVTWLKPCSLADSSTATAVSIASFRWFNDVLSQASLLLHSIESCLACLRLSRLISCRAVSPQPKATLNDPFAKCLRVLCGHVDRLKFCVKLGTRISKSSRNLTQWRTVSCLACSLARLLAIALGCSHSVCVSKPLSCLAAGEISRFRVA